VCIHVRFIPMCIGIDVIVYVLTADIFGISESDRFYLFYIIFCIQLLNELFI
jgi:hypothetical protein